MLFEDLCSTKKHGNMSIMTACMHLSRYFTLVLPLHHFLRLKKQNKSTKYSRNSVALRNITHKLEKGRRANNENLIRGKALVFNQTQMDGFHNNNKFFGIDYRYPPWKEIMFELCRITACTCRKVLPSSIYHSQGTRIRDLLIIKLEQLQIS